MCIDVTSPPLTVETICYGALCGVKVKLSTTLLPDLSITGWDQFYELEVFRKSTNYHLRRNRDTEDVGVLDLISTGILKPLREWPEVTQTAVLLLSDLKKLAKKKKQNTLIVDASINLLGPETLLNSVGDAITKGNGYLQHPCFLHTGIKYINPHYFYPHGSRTDLGHLVGPAKEDAGAVSLSQGLGEILNSLAQSGQSASKYSGSLEAACAEGMIVTPLKSHQEEGVKSILAREDVEHSASAAQLCEGVIGYQEFDRRSSSFLGGINADVMGLGKTLTMLSAVVCSLSAARDFATLNTELPTTRATLVVATSSQVLDVWKSEIKKHLRPDILRLCIFHGDNRAKVVEDIIDNDVVLTTYHTLVSDCKSKSLLQRLMWFRVVLDEAHWIRNTTSQQFKAARNLTAQRRWCLSGTPIQNSLDDLRSLLDFLHFHPFSEPNFFRKHIVEPLRTESPDPYRNLRLLLRIICFRRTSELLSLPPHVIEEVPIPLTDGEVRLYEDILAKCKREFEEVTNMRSSRKKHCILFATIMSLRRLCNHGIFQQDNAALEVRTPDRGAKKSNRQKQEAEEEIWCAYCYGDNADTIITLGALEVCPECSRTLEHGATRESKSISPMPSATSDGDFMSSGWRANDLPLSILSPLRRDTGFSSKLNAVVNNIEISPVSSKNIVLTSWRLTLDILKHLLDQRGIPCLRIDGKTSFPERQSILTLFCEDPGQSVLLLSIATGAVGLTLTVADRVHIVEPQWNPSVEEQAIGRALRIGQNRCVTIFKYIAERTVEQNIVFLQKKKSRLAKISLDACNGGQAEERLEDLMFVLQ
ncbi:SNF2 family N-terminal domain-containing protein [Biscogniauxia marginata]|nr:SNF2 family N-terminal domain-containing protein [Biscogniauxia marginata]